MERKGLGGGLIESGNGAKWDKLNGYTYRGKIYKYV